MTESTGSHDNDPDKIARAVEDLEGAWFIGVVLVLIGIAWSIVAVIARLGLLTWAIGAAIWAILLFLSARSIHSSRCPRCGQPWPAPSAKPAAVWGAANLLSTL
jgi:apolipoprotein N-acyltransferase